MTQKPHFQQYRKLAGLTLMEAAEKMGVAYQTVYKWERGENSPTIDTVVRLAEVYHIEPSDFFIDPFELGQRKLGLDDIRALAKVAGIEPAAFTWIAGDLSRIDEAEAFSRMAQAFAQLDPDSREHWIRIAATFPGGEDPGKRSRRSSS